MSVTCPPPDSRGPACALGGDAHIKGAFSEGWGHFPREDLVSCPPARAAHPSPGRSEQLQTAYFEKADACVTAWRCEVLVVIEVDVAKAPGMCKLLPTAIKNPRTAQVPAWPGEREHGHRSLCGLHGLAVQERKQQLRAPATGWCGV